MPAGAFNTGKLMFGYSGDAMTHYRLYWGTSQGSWPNMLEYLASVTEVDLRDVVPAPGSYYMKLKVWNGEREFGDTGEINVIADIGHIRLRR